jgi:hypothetical protein
MTFCHCREQGIRGHRIAGVPRDMVQLATPRGPDHVNAIIIECEYYYLNEGQSLGQTIRTGRETCGSSQKAQTHFDEAHVRSRLRALTLEIIHGPVSMSADQKP